MLEEVYTGSGSLKEGLLDLMQETRDTIDGLGNYTATLPEQLAG